MVFDGGPKVESLEWTEFEDVDLAEDMDDCAGIEVEHHLKK